MDCESKPVVDKIIERISYFTKAPRTNFEYMQVLDYLKGKMKTVLRWI